MECIHITVIFKQSIQTQKLYRIETMYRQSSSIYSGKHHRTDEKVDIGPVMIVLGTTSNLKSILIIIPVPLASSGISLRKIIDENLNQSFQKCVNWQQSYESYSKVIETACPKGRKIFIHFLIYLLLSTIKGTLTSKVPNSC